MAASTRCVSDISTPTATRKIAIWLLLSIAIAVLYGLPHLYRAFSGDYVAQDDARQHVFWMQRFADPDLFPNDLLADYFQSVAPQGYTSLYRLGVGLGFDVWTFNKILPIFIAVVATIFAFGVVLEMVQLPVAGFITAIFLNQTFPIRDDVVSATPAAFFYPFFFAFLYFALRKQWLLCCSAIALMGLFYPQGVLVMGCTFVIKALASLRWRKGQVTVQADRADLWLIGSGLLTGFLILLPYALRDSIYGPVLTLAQAQEMFALSPQGWSKFFVADPKDYWFCGKRSGMFPTEWCRPDLKVQPQIWLTLALPFLLFRTRRSPFTQKITARAALLLQVAIASLICYFLAQILLFELHLPNRYTEHSFRALVAVGIGVAAALLWNQWQRSRRRQRKRLWLSLIALWAIAPLAIGVLAGEFRGNYYYGQYPGLYEFLKQQPKDTVVVSLDPEINNIPSFAQRSIFVGGEGFTLPYHLGYYNEVKRRSLALIEAQYATDADVLDQFLTDHDIDYWLVSADMFAAPWIQQSFWILQYSQDTDVAFQSIENPEKPVLTAAFDVCSVAQFESLALLDTACVRSRLSELQ